MEYGKKTSVDCFLHYNIYITFLMLGPMLCGGLHGRYHIAYLNFNVSLPSVPIAIYVEMKLTPSVRRCAK